MSNPTKRRKLSDDELSDDELPPLVDSDQSDDNMESETSDELPPLIDSEDDDEIPPLVEDPDEEEGSDSDDELPPLVDSEEDDDDDENWEDVSDSDSEHYFGDDRVSHRITHMGALPPLVNISSDEEETDEDDFSSSSSSDFDFPFFLQPNRNNPAQRMQHPFRSMPNSSDEEDTDDSYDDDSHDESENSRIRDTQGILHASTRSGTHNKYWTQISSSEKSKLDTLYRNVEDSFKFNTSDQAPSSSSSNTTTLATIHNMEEFLDDIIQLITSHSLCAVEVSSMFEYSRLAQKQALPNRYPLLLALLLAIKIKYLKDL